MTRIILIGGTGRSGTSIVKEILARHPEAASLPFEYRFITDPDGVVDFYSGYTSVWSPYLADRKLQRFRHFLTNLSRESLHHRFLGWLLRWWNPDGKTLSPRAYHGWNLNRHLPNWDRHVEDLMSKLVEFSFPACWVGTTSYQWRPQVLYAGPKTKSWLASVLGDFIRAAIDDLLDNTGKRFFVEDNTWNVLFAKEILELLPEAKIIHVLRDPRDVIASFSHQRWSPQDKKKGAYWYRDMILHWFEVRSSLPTGSYVELELENLVDNPETVIQDVCHFTDLSFSRDLLKVDLSHSNKGRWKQEYTKEEKEEVHAILSPLITELGYDLSD